MNDDSTDESPAANLKGGPDLGPLPRRAGGLPPWFWPKAVPLGLFVSVLVLSWLMVLSLPEEREPVVERWTRGEDPRSFVAVLPFKNIGEESRLQPLADGMTEEFISALARLDPDRLGVIASGSVIQYGESPPGLREVADELQVESVIEGGVRVSGDRVLVEARLVDCSSGLMLWSDGQWRPYCELFALLHELSVAIAGLLEIPPASSFPDAATLAQQGSDRDEAYAAYLEGCAKGRETEPAIWAQALEHFGQALGHDPLFARAWEAQAEVRLRLAEVGAAAGSYDAAESDAKKALAITEDASRAWVVLARVLFVRDLDWTQAEASFRKAVTLDPGRAEAQAAGVELWLARGSFDEAIEHATAAMQLDPRDHHVRADLAWALLCAGRYDDARREAGRVLLEEDQLELALEVEFLALLGQRELSAALELARATHASATDDRLEQIETMLAEEALSFLFERRLDDLRASADVDPFELACACDQAGQAEDGLAALRDAWVRGDPRALGARFDPRLAGLREHPDFEAVAGGTERERDQP